MYTYLLGGVQLGGCRGRVCVTLGGIMVLANIFVCVLFTHNAQVDEEHERYFKNIEAIDPEFTSSVTHFIVLDTRR